MKFRKYAEIKKIFLYNLFALCDDSGMSMNYIAKQTGTHANNLNKYRYHGKSISEDKIFNMAKQLKLPQEKIFTAQKYEAAEKN